jgi:hypothetical protein
LEGGAVGLDAGFGSSSYESSSFSSGGVGGASLIAGGAGFGFGAADTNLDGSLDQGEFGSFVGKYSFQ